MSIFLFANDEESSGKINIDDLYEKKKSRDLKQLSIFNKILNRLHKKITLTGRNKRNDRHVWFVVPEYIFGEPVYDVGECIAYIYTKLEENGFLVKYIHPNTIFVSWLNWVPSYVRSEFRKKTGNIMSESGKITESEKKEEEDVNSGIFKTANGTMKKNVKDQRQFTPIDKYKPTGKFVYNPDLLEKIDNKIN